MTKLKNPSQLQEKMQEEFAWRKKELTSLKSLVTTNQGRGNETLCIRAAVTLLYAHWEGFIKQVGSYYLEFVARQRLKHSELQSSFLAHVIGRMINEAASTTKTKQRLRVVEFFRTQLNERSNLVFSSGVNTKSNLKSEVLCDIIQLLGLEYTEYQTKEKLIDEKLLQNRNSIAHGKATSVDVDEYLVLHDEILGLMQLFYNQIENAVLTKAYAYPPALV